MLQLSGNSETAFAGLNSIVIAPIVYAEWNYNSISKPYVVTPTSDGPISSPTLSNPANWVTSNAAIPLTDTLSSFISDFDTAASAINFYIPSKKATLSSPSISVTPKNNSYYKMVFYVKADQAGSYPTLKTIDKNAITAYPDVAGSGKALYYRINPVGNNGKSIYNDVDGLNVVPVVMSPAATSVALEFNTNDYSANAYNIYRGTASSFLPYITTFSLKEIKVKTFDNTVTPTTASLTFENYAGIKNGEKFIIYNDNIKFSFLNKTVWQIVSSNSSHVFTASLVSSSQKVRSVSFNINNWKTEKSWAKFFTYTDDLSNISKYVHAPAIHSTKIDIIPKIKLTNNGNLIETTQQFVKIYDTDFSDPDFINSKIDLDSLKYKKVEMFFGSNEIFDNIQLFIDVNSSYDGAQVLLYRPEIFLIDSWNFYSTSYYPIESCFNPFRPGESLLHPYINNNDLLINKDSKINTASSKPVSFATLNPDFLFGQIAPYKQMFDSTLNNNFRYYVSPDLKNSNTNFSIRAQYNDMMSINKIVVKGINLYSDLTTASGNITLLQTGGASTVIPFSAGAFDSHGILDLYYDNNAWSTTRPETQTYPAKISDSGVLLNVTGSVTGIILTVGGLSNTYINDAKSKIEYKNLRAHIVEISPRLEVDISNLVQGITVDKTLDNAESTAGFPIGYINSNTANLTLNNIPVYKNSFPHTIFDAFSESSTFYNLLKKNVKITGFLKSPNNDFTDIIPFFTMYTDQWNMNSTSEVELVLFDGIKNQLMSLQTIDYSSDGESLSRTITNLLDSVGFSDYDYDGLMQVLKNRNINISHFWTDRSKQTVVETLQSLFVAHQIGATFDEYGILRFVDIDKIIYSFNDKTLTPNFAVTDIPIAITNSSDIRILYISNILKDTFSESNTSNIGKITINYRIPNRNFKDQQNVNGMANKEEVVDSLWKANPSAVIKSLSNRSIKYNDNNFYIKPDYVNLGTANSTPTFMINTKDYAFLNGELIKWEGLEYRFFPLLGFDQTTVIPNYSTGTNVMISDQQDIAITIDEMQNLDNRINQIRYQFTGKVMGVSRGLKGTSIRNHFLYDDVATPASYYNSSNYFNKNVITSSVNVTSLTPSNQTSTIIFDKNIATFILKKQKNSTTYPIYISPKSSSDVGDMSTPTSASTFNYFTTVFAAPDFSSFKWNQINDKQQLELGIQIDTNYGKLMFSIYNSEGKSYIKTDNEYCSYVLRKISSKGINGGEIIPHLNVKNVFDGRSHRFSVIFTNSPNYSYPSQPDSNNKMSYSYVTFYVDNVRYGPYAIGTKGSVAGAVPKKDFGVYAKNLAKHSNSSQPSEFTKTIHFTELYACRWWGDYGYAILGARYKWHWETERFLNLLVRNAPNSEPPYYYWGPNILTGVYFYDNETFSTSPARPKKMYLDFSGYDPKSTSTNLYATLQYTSSTSIRKSRLLATPFRAKFAVSNSDNQIVFLATADKKVNQGTIEPLEISGTVSALSDPIQIDKIIDPTMISNNIQLDSSWIQSRLDAERLMEKLSILCNCFNSDLNVTIFGNPLIQIGDYCQLIFSVKKIGFDPENADSLNYKKIFFVKSVTQTYNEGLNTSLVLKPMFYLPQ
jgi:hypothetical protein